jgi:hypothetical protein
MQTAHAIAPTNRCSSLRPRTYKTAAKKIAMARTVFVTSNTPKSFGSLIATEKISYAR